jgi:hypothetical protein
MASLMGLGSIFGPLAMTQTLAHFTGPGARHQFPGAVFLLAAGLATLTLIVLLIQVRRRVAAR